MPTLFPQHPGQRSAAILAAALAGPFAMATITVTPPIAHVRSGGNQLFQVAGALGTTIPGDWEAGQMDPQTGAWRAVPMAQAGRLTRVGGRASFTARQVTHPTVWVFRFTPTQSNEAPVLVPVRITPPLETPHVEAQPLLSDKAPSSSGSVTADREQAPLEDEGPPRRWSPAQQPKASSQNLSPSLATPEDSQRRSLSPHPSAPATPSDTTVRQQDGVSAIGSSVVYNDGHAFEDPDDSLDSSFQLPLSPTAAKLKAAPDLRGLPMEKVSPPKHHKRAGSQLPLSAAVTYNPGPEMTLGEGSHASVVKVTLKDGTALAAKMFPRALYDAEGAEGAENRARLAHERELMRSLNHPNIIQYQGFRAERDDYFLIMELATQSFDDLCRHSHGGLPEAMIRAHARQLLAGLAYLQAKQIVHGDFKSGNVLISKDGTLKIADFGSAQSYKAGKKYLKPQFDGCTPMWTAPEMLLDGYDGKADIWAFGCVLLEMLSGQAPWASRHFQSPDDVFLELMTGRDLPAIPAHTSPALRALVLRCLHRDPDQRPWAQELLQDPFLAEPDSRSNQSSSHSPPTSRAAPG